MVTMDSGIVFVSLLVGQWIADHWVQTPRQAERKTERHWPGVAACATHVAATTLCQLLVLLLAGTAHTLGAVQLLAGLVLAALAHYWADRRHTLEGLALVLGKHDHYSRGGAAAMTRTWHAGWLLMATVLITAATPWQALGLLPMFLLVLVGMELLSRLGNASRPRPDTIVIYHP